MPGFKDSVTGKREPELLSKDGNQLTNVAAMDITISGEDQVNDHLVVRPPAMSITNWKYHVPAENTKATIAAAASTAGSGIKHVVTSIQASIHAADGAPTAAAPAVVSLKDGSNVVWSSSLAVPTVAGQVNQISIGGLWIVGTAETAMTLEFTAAAGTDTFECVSFTYVDIV